jgi:putative transposase
MDSREYLHQHHSVGNNVHHLQWCTKYRYEMFRKEKNAALCRAAIEDVAKRHKIEIKELAVMPEHVHIVAQIPATMSQSEAMRILKGGSSYAMLRLNEKFRLRFPRGNLWSRGNFKDSVGRITEETALNYVRSQDTMHMKSAGFSPQFT